MSFEVSRNWPRNNFQLF